MTHLPSIITDLAILLIVAGIVTVIFKWLKQPVVLGYIVAGFLTGAHSGFFPSVGDGSSLSTWGEIGVIFLLFALGLEFSFKKLINNGKTGFITLMCIILGLGVSGYFLGTLLGWGMWNSLILGGMLCLSSTTIIVKAFDDPRYKGKRFTEVVFGILIFDDLFAILLMVFMGTLAVSRNVEGMEIAFSIAKMLFFMVVWVVCGIFLVPTMLKKMRKLLNDETLLIVSLGMCLGMVVFATKVGLSAELGAFIMGSILAETVALENIERVTKPIKDFFGAIFFVSVGMMLDPSVIVEHYKSVLLITLLVLVGKVVFTAIGARLSGESMQVSIKSGFSMAQVGEFSFIVAGTAIAYQLADNFIYPIIIAVSIITTFTTPYFMAVSGKAYGLLMRSIPNKWRQKIEDTDAKLKERTPPSTWRAFIQNYIFNIIVFSSLCVAAIGLSVSFLNPYLIGRLGEKWADAISIIVTLLVMAPLLKGLVYRGGEQPYLILKLWRQSVGNRLVLSVFITIRYVIALALVYFTFLRFLAFPVWVSAVVALVVMIVVFRSRYLMRLYWNIEYRFILNFNERVIHDRRKTSRDSEGVTTFSPDGSTWLGQNLYVARFLLHDGSEYVDKELNHSDFRDKYGLIIVSVFRHKKEQSLPTGGFTLKAGDVITVMGSIEKINRLTRDRNKMELHRDSLVTITQFAQKLSENPHSKLQAVALFVDKNSGLCGMTIEQSEMGKRGVSYVVGIENSRGYKINPPASEVLRKGDIIWVVGNKDCVHDLVNQSFFCS